MSRPIGSPPDEAWNNLLVALAGFALMIGILWLVMYWGRSQHDQYLRAEKVCTDAGMELIETEVSRGKYRDVFYQCRDAAGIVHALPRGEK